MISFNLFGGGGQLQRVLFPSCLWRPRVGLELVILLPRPAGCWVVACVSHCGFQGVDAIEDKSYKLNRDITLNLFPCDCPWVSPVQSDSVLLTMGTEVRS